MKALLCLLALTVLTCTTYAQPRVASNTPAVRVLSGSDSASVAEHFEELAQKWLRAYNSGDSTTLTSLYTLDAQYISSHVQGLVAEGRDRVIANFQRGVKMGGHIDAVSILSMQMSCDLATLLCKYEATNSGQKAVGRNLLVVKKVNGKWLIALHMTVV